VEDDIIDSVTVDKQPQWFPPVFLTVKDRYVKTMKILKKPYRLRQKIAPTKKNPNEENDEEQEPEKGGKVIASFTPCSIVYMKQPEPYEIQKRLIKICELRGIVTAGIDSIARGALKDVRKAVNLLQECCKVLDGGRYMNLDYVRKTVEWYNDVDAFGGLAVDHAKKLLYNNWSVNEFYVSAISASDITKLYFWNNMYHLIEDNYGKLQHPIAKCLDYIPDELVKSKEDFYRRELQPMNLRHIVHQISDSLSTAGLFQKIQYEDGANYAVGDEYGCFFDLVLPSKYVKFPDRLGTTDVGLPFGQLHTPNFNLLSTTNKSAKFAKDFCFRKGLSTSDGSLWEYSLTFVKRFNCWCHRDLKPKTLIECANGLREWIVETRRRINYEFLRWKKNEQYENEKSQLYDIKRKKFEYSVKYSKSKDSTKDEWTDQELEVVRSMVIKGFCHIIMRIFPEHKEEDLETDDISFKDYCYLKESKDGKSDILEVDLRSIPNDIFDEFKATYKRSIQSILLPKFSTKGILFERLSTDPELEVELLAKLELDLLELQHLYLDKKDTSLIAIKRIFEPTKVDILDDDEQNVLDDNADNIEKYLEEYDEGEDEFDDDPFIKDEDTTTHHSDIAKSLLDMFDCYREQMRQNRKVAKSKKNGKTSRDLDLAEWDDLEACKDEIAALLVATGFYPKDIAVMSKYLKINGECEIGPQLPWLDKPKKKSQSLADRMDKFLTKANKFGFGLTGRKIKVLYD
jgi:hypothetical protein